MTVEGHCEQCGAVIPDSAPGGLCPNCLLKAGMDGVPRAGEDADRLGTTVPLPDRPTVPGSSGSTFAGIDEAPGRYTYLGEHARGGMGRVLLVHDRHLNRDLALKELLPESSSATPADKPSPVRASVPHVARFLQEARVTGQLEHPSIVPVYELGHRRDGTLYYTMKLVRGRTLSQALREASTLEERMKLLSHFIDLCQAIAYAHSRGVIHRDIKPSNVMVGEFGETVVLDWGLAKARTHDDIHADDMRDTLDAIRVGDEEKLGRTAYGQVLGTPSYMPPEQALGQLDKMDGRSDVYGLGAVLYELLTGSVPFEGKSTREVLHKVLTEEPMPVRHRCPDAPPELVAVCSRAMAKDPANRYQSAKELADDVQQFTSGALVKAYEYGLHEHLKRFYYRHRPLIVTVIGAAVVLLAGGVYSYVNVVKARDREQAMRVHAEEAQHEAEEAELAAQRSAYSAGMTLGGHLLDSGQYNQANSVLWKVPPTLRGTDWALLLLTANYHVWSDAVLSDVSNDMVSPDGVVLTHGSSLRRLRDGTEVGSFRLPESPKMEPKALHPLTGQVLVVNRDNLHIYSAQHKREASIPLPELAAFRLVCSANSPHALIANWPNDGIVVDLQKQAIVANIRLAGAMGGSFEFSPDGKWFVTTAPDQRVEFWSTDNWQMQARYAGKAAFRISPDESLTILLSEDGNLTAVWPDQSFDEVPVPLPGEGDEFPISAMAAHAGSRLVAVGVGIYYLWLIPLESPQDAVRLVGWDRNKAPITGVEFSASGNVLATADQRGRLELFSVQSECAMMTIEKPLVSFGEPLEIDSLKFVEGDEFIMVRSSESLSVWDIGLMSRTVKTLRSARATKYAFGTDGQCVVTLRDGFTPAIWDAAKGTVTKLSPAPPSNNYDRGAYWSPRGDFILLVSLNGTTHTWEPATDKILASTEVGDDIQDVEFDGTDSCVGFAEATLKSIFVYDVKSLELLKRIEVPELTPQCVALKMSCNRLACGTKEGQVLVYSLDKQSEPLGIEVSEQAICDIVFLKDRDEFAAVTWNGELTLVNYETGKLRIVEQFHSFPLLAAQLVERERRLWVCSLVGDATIWDTDAEEIVARMSVGDPWEGFAVGPMGEILASRGNGLRLIYTPPVQQENALEPGDSFWKDRYHTWKNKRLPQPITLDEFQDALSSAFAAADLSGAA